MVARSNEDAPVLQEAYVFLTGKMFDANPRLEGDEYDCLYEDELCFAGSVVTDAMLRLILKERGAAYDGGA